MNFTNWQRPSDDDLKLEYNLEYAIKPLKSMLGNPWPKVEDFLETAKNSKLEVISNSNDDRMGYRTHTRTREELYSLIRGYRSYPKFRNEGTIDNLYDRFSTNKTMTAPIVIRWPNGKMRVMGGNTRMDVARQLGVKLKALVIDVS